MGNSQQLFSQERLHFRVTDQQNNRGRHLGQKSKCKLTLLGPDLVTSSSPTDSLRSTHYIRQPESHHSLPHRFAFSATAFYSVCAHAGREAVDNGDAMDKSTAVGDVVGRALARNKNMVNKQVSNVGRDNYSSPLLSI